MNQLTRYFKFYKLLCGVVLVSLSFESNYAAIPLNNNSSDHAIMLPNVEQQVIETGSTFFITCIFRRPFVEKENFIEWQLPDFVQQRTDVLTQDQNETHITSTITLTNALPSETGFYKCFNLNYPERTLQQYVYIYSEEEPVIFDSTLLDLRLVFKHGGTGLVPCKPTHPNISISLKRTDTYNVDEIPEDNYLQNLLTTPKSEWRLEPEKGLLLRKVTLDDFGSYECLAFNKSKGIPFRIVVSGIEVIRVESQQVPAKNGGVALLCRAYMFPSPPQWTYLNSKSGKMEPINEIHPPQGLKIETKKTELAGEKMAAYQSLLLITNYKIILPTTFACVATNSENQEI